jgi:lipid-binding SYLF domain-containing protein
MCDNNSGRWFGHAAPGPGADCAMGARRWNLSQWREIADQKGAEEMKPRISLFLGIAVLAVAGTVTPVRVQAEGEVQKVLDAARVMREIQAIPESSIPPYLLRDAHAVGIFPELFKAGFFIGGRYGTGVIVVRDQSGQWSNPVFARLGGGSFGWQFGLQASDVILVFRSHSSIDAVIRGTFTLGVDAAVVAGPVGRRAEAATDYQLRAEIYSYSRSRGLFLGVAIEGAMLQINYGANSRFYGRPGLLASQIFVDRSMPAPPEADELRRAIGY